jgi:methyl-accepting chemotaxis protein
MKIGTRLGVGFGAILFLMAVLSALSWKELSTVNKTMDEALVAEGQGQAIEALEVSLQDVYLGLWKMATAVDKEAKIKSEEGLKKSRASYMKALEEVKNKEKDVVILSMLTGVENKIAEARECNGKVAKLSRESEGRSAEALEIMTTKSMPFFENEVQPLLAKLVEETEKNVEECEHAAEESYSIATTILITGVALCLIIGLVLSILITRSIVLPVKNCVDFTTILASGDFSKDVPTDFQNRKDEIGELAKGYQVMVSNTRSLLKNTIEGINTLSASSTELSAVATQTTQSVATLKNKVSTVASAAEESSVNAVSIASSMEETSTNITSVSSATEEMTATIGEIASNAEKARAISNEAKTQSDGVIVSIQSLEEAMKEINKITSTIDDIASQTNLLALNATIEAQRAGAAGKGFAVVASEIKQLSIKTAVSTKDIKEKVESIQKLMGKSTTDVKDVVSTLGQVNNIVNSIAAAIEEQSVVTKSVAENVQQASTGVKDANERVSQSAVAAKSTAQDVAGIDTATSEIQVAGTQVQASALELSKLSEQLKTLVSKFKA